MSLSSLEFLNKNQFRSYPLKAESSLTAIDGRKVSNELLVGASITTTLDRKNIFIRQIYVDGVDVRITLAAKLSNSFFETIGIFYGTITSEFTVLRLTETMKFTSGTLIIGTVEALNELSGVYTFEPGAMELEESTVFYYTPPGVTSINYRGARLTGDVNFGVLSNIIKSRPVDSPKKIDFGVIDSASVTSLGDKSSLFNNCPTPVIRYIDGAVPFYQSSTSVDSHNTYNYLPALQGNLFMVGVAPLSFQSQQNIDNSNQLVDLGGLSVTANSITSGAPITLNTLCNARNSVLPPISPIYIKRGTLPGSNPSAAGLDSYYTKSAYHAGNLYSVTDPEFMWWPQFFTYSSITPINPITANAGSTMLIGKVSINPASAKQKYSLSLIYVNTGAATLAVSLLRTTKLISGAPSTSNVEGFQRIVIPPNSSTTVRTVNDSIYPTHSNSGLGYAVPMNIVDGDTFSVYFDSVSGGVSTLQPYLYYR
jgi:hypothetical protein